MEALVQLRAVLGGNVEMLVSGSAPVSREVMDFLKVAFSCAVQEGVFVSHLSCVDLVLICLSI